MATNPCDGEVAEKGGSMPVDTRQILADSFRELCENTHIDKIQIKDIAKHAGLSRQTFYNYFTDKTDLALWIWAHNFENPVEEVADYDNYLLKATEIMEKDREFYLDAYKYLEFGKRQEQWLVDMMSASIERRFGNKKLESLRYALRIWAAGSFTLWLRDVDARNFPKTFEQAAKERRKNMPPELVEAFPRREGQGC